MPTGGASWRSAGWVALDATGSAVDVTSLRPPVTAEPSASSGSLASMSEYDEQPATALRRSTVPSWMDRRVHADRRRRHGRPVTGDGWEAPATGVPAVDDVLASVQALDDRPVEEHVAVFEQAHERLRRALDPGHG